MGLVEIYVNGVKVNTTEVGDNFIYRDTSKAGIYNVSAKYLGDETADTVYAPSSSQNYTFTVKLYSIDIGISYWNYHYYNSQVSVVFNPAWESLQTRLNW